MIPVPRGEPLRQDQGDINQTGRWDGRGAEGGRGEEQETGEKRIRSHLAAGAESASETLGFDRLRLDTCRTLETRLARQPELVAE